MKKNSFSSAFKYLGGLGLGIFLFYLSLRNVDFSELKNHLIKANYWWVLLGVFVAIISHFFRALRWKMLMKAAGHQIRTSSSFASIMVGYLVNNAVPRAGEITRASLLSRADKVPFSISLATILTDRIFDVICLGILVTVSILLETEKLLQYFSPFVEKVITYLSNLDILWVFGILIGLSVLAAGGFFILIKKSGGSLFEKVQKFLKEMMDAVLSVRNLSNPILFIGYTLSIWICYILMTYLVFFSLPETSSFGFSFALIAFTMGGIGMVVPSPGGIGSYHAAFSWTFGAFAAELSLTKASALAIGNSLAIIIHTSQLIMMVFVGIICYVFLLFISDKSTEVLKENIKE